MKASELRIGNWVNCLKIVDGDKIREISCWDFGTYLSTNPEYYSPIPLTEEWLFKFGFEIGYNQKKMLDVYCKDFGLLIERSNSNNFYYKKVNIQNIHQLQNLYFALTGEELVLKE